MRYIDVHCHLTNEEEYAAANGVDRVIADGAEAGVKTLVVSGYDLRSSRGALFLAEKYENVFFCAGFQPEELSFYESDFQNGGNAFSEALNELKSLLSHPKCVAVGEIGLDYHFADNPSEAFQRDVFLKQLRLADEAQLPFVVHSRDACADTLALLKENAALIRRGFLMHCYSYSAEAVADFFSLGAYFSFGGVVTFKKAEKTKRAALAVPHDRILTETDSPYLTPEPHRGAFPNTPQNVAHTARYLAELRGETIEDFCANVQKNALSLFPRLSAR